MSENTWKDNKPFCFEGAKSSCALIKLLLFRHTEVHKCKFFAAVKVGCYQHGQIFDSHRNYKCLQLFDRRAYFCFSLLFHQVSLCQLERVVLQRPLYCKDRQRDCLVHLAWVVVFSEICCHEGQTRRL